MIPVTSYHGRTVAVFGLGRSGISTALALQAGGSKVCAWDENEESRCLAYAAGVQLEDLYRRDWGDVSALVLSPGVPLHHPEPHKIVQLAKSVEVPIIGDMDLFAREVGLVDDVTVIGVTGTNGKSTTTALIGHVLREAGRDVRVGGNIGDAVLGLESPRAGAIYVLELSSYQLDLTKRLHCQIGLFLNISPDHLDRHGSMDNYITAKKRIFAHMRGDDTAIIGVDDSNSSSIFAQLNQAGLCRVLPISASKVLSKGVYALGSDIFDGLLSNPIRVGELQRAAALRGRHNAQNAVAAYTACRAVGIATRDILNAFMTFPGLPHRQESVGMIGKVSFINDSKATNAEAASKALGAYEDVFWIAGGQAKDENLAVLKDQARHIRKAFFIGQDGMAMKSTFSELQSEYCETLEKAIAIATKEALESDAEHPVVLLSPAGASFDQFTSYEHRGDSFREYVAQLIDKAHSGDAA